jgi:hypothetical protein
MKTFDDVKSKALKNHLKELEKAVRLHAITYDESGLYLKRYDAAVDSVVKCVNRISGNKEVRERKWLG